jgi:eukaryotic-like serine/threonine-protein kinase
MLGDSVRRRQRRSPERRTKARGTADRRAGWQRWLPWAVAAVVLPFAIGYLIASYIIFPPIGSSAAGIPVPALFGLHASEAERAVADATLAGLDVTEQPHPNAPAGTIIAQSPLPGQQLRSGARVIVAVSSGRPRGVVPDVVGFDSQRAHVLLARLGFIIEEQREPAFAPIGRVLRIDPQPGSARDLPSVVTLTVSDGPPQAVPDEVPPDTIPPPPSAGAGR